MINTSKFFPDGVTGYTMGKVILPVGFPNNNVACGFCKFIRANERLNRYYCSLTNEIIWLPFDDVGVECPIKLD